MRELLDIATYLAEFIVRIGAAALTLKQLILLLKNIFERFLKKPENVRFSDIEHQYSPYQITI